MKYLLAAVLSVLVAGNVTADSCPFLHLQQQVKNGRVHLIAKNTAKQPIVAYVVVGDNGNEHSVWKNMYSGGPFKVGKFTDIGEVPGASNTLTTKVFVDYVRLADGTSWGSVSTTEAKELAAHYQN